jgi:AcrR family transcriptional regulator
MTTTAPESGSTRMRSEDRRVLILEAATAVFGEQGYHGATTDAIARAAGVSQPYVVRMFGSKEALLGAEHAHDVRLADASGARDLVGRCAVVAEIAEHGGRGQDDELSPVFRLHSRYRHIHRGHI